MAFLKIKSMYVIGNANGECLGSCAPSMIPGHLSSPPSPDRSSAHYLHFHSNPIPSLPAPPHHSCRAGTNDAFLEATTVDLQILGTAEPATAIMAASIPMLRVLIQRDSGSKPSRFIELVKSVSSPSGAGLKSTGEESWSENPSAGSGRHSTVRLRGDDVQQSYTWVAYGGKR
jgi:hypothetical protein